MAESSTSHSTSGFGSNELLPLSDTHTPDDVSTASQDPSRWKDFLGITASVACAIHCAAMPFVIGFLPALGLTFLADESFHKWMAGACFVFALAAFIPGWKRHRRCMPAAVAAAGLAIVTTTAFALSGECCPACEVPSQSAVATVAAMTDPSAATAADCCDEHCDHCEEESVASNGSEEASRTLGVTEADCHDEHCEHCAASIDDARTDDQASGTPPTTAGITDFLTNNAAWWSPLGGALLVFAHMLNRCFVSRCICCTPRT